jgi:hypothetical protein
MRVVSRLIGAAYGLAGLGNLATLLDSPTGLAWPAGNGWADLAVLASVGLFAAAQGLAAYAFLTLKPWGRWPSTVINLLYLLLGLVFFYKPAAVPHLLAAAALGVIWWSWQPGFPAGPLRFRGSGGPRAVLSTSVLVLPVLLVALAGFEAQRDLRRCGQEFVLDGREGCVTPLFFQEDTEYAPGYSAAAFQQLRVGMSEQEVRALLGPPIEGDAVPSSGTVGWRWTATPSSRTDGSR